MARTVAETVKIAGDYMNAKKFDKAVKAYRAALQQAPEDDRIWSRLITCYRKLNARGEAVKACIKLAEIHLKKGEVDKAIEDYRLMTEADPENPTVHRKMAIECHRHGFASDAALHYSKASQLFIARQLVEEAADMLRGAAKVRPGNVPSYLDLLRLYIKEGLKSKASTEIRWMAEALKKLGQKEDLAKLYNQYLKDDAGNVECLRDHYRNLLDLGRHEEAIPFMERILHIDPENDEVIAHSVEIYKGTGDKERELEATFRLARRMMNQGERDRAVELFNRALELDPNHEGAAKALKKLTSRPDDDEAPEELEAAQSADPFEDGDFIIDLDLGDIVYRKG